MSEPIRAGVLGVGSLGRYHAQKFAAHGEAELVGVFDPDMERAQAVAAETGCVAFPDAGSLVEGVDAVVIAAPTEVHADLGMNALNAGVNVLMEKPLAASRAEADDLIAAAEASGRVLQVGHLMRFHPGVRRLAGTGIDRRPPRYLEANRLNTFQPRSLDIDVILDLMVHDLDLIMHWVGSNVAEVRAIGIPVVTDKVDMANARIAFDSGAVANLTASRVARKQVREVRMFQPHRYVSVDFVDSTMGVYELDASAGDGPVPGARGEQLELDHADLLAEEVDAFLKACAGRPNDGVSGREGRAALGLGLDVRAAIDEHFSRYGVSSLQEVGP